MEKLPRFLDEICENCGCSFGSHSGSSYYSKHYNMLVPINYCPGHEHRMDWDKGPGTIFKPTGKYREEEGANHE